MRRSRQRRKSALFIGLLLASALGASAQAQVAPVPNRDLDCENGEEAAYASILKSHGLSSGDQIGPLLDRSPPGQFPELEAAEFYFRGRVWGDHWRSEMRALETLDAFERAGLARLAQSNKNQNTMSQIGRVGAFPLPVTMTPSCGDNYRTNLNDSIRQSERISSEMNGRWRSKVAEACGLQLSLMLEGHAAVPAAKREENMHGYTETRYGENYTEWEREDRANKLHVKIKWNYVGLPRRLMPGQSFEIDVKAAILQDSPTGTVDRVTLSGLISVYGDVEVKSGQDAIRPGLKSVYQLVVKKNAKSAEIHFGGAPMGTGAIWKFSLPKN